LFQRLTAEIYVIYGSCKPLWRGASDDLVYG
jgi:hypothetical protein